MRAFGFLARLLRCADGNAVTIVAFAMPVLIGFAGLAVDMSQWYMWKRELQFAADQAAVSGAWARSRSSEASSYATRAQQEFSANMSIAEGFTANPQVSLVDYGGESQNAVKVDVSATRALPFSSMFTDVATTVTVSATAIWQGDGEGTTFNSCLLALSHTESSAVEFNGNPTVNAGCGLASLSTASDSIRISGAPGYYDLGWIYSAGGIYDRHGGFDNNEINTNVRGMSDPYDGLTPPENPTPRTLSCSSSSPYTADVKTAVNVRYDYFRGANQNNNSSWTNPSALPPTQSVTNTSGVSFAMPPTNTTRELVTWLQIGGSGSQKQWERQTATTTIEYSNIVNTGGTAMLPGTYRDFTIRCDTTLTPGIYVLDGTDLSITGAHRLMGRRVMFVLKNGAQIKIGGTATIRLTGIPAEDLVALGASPEDAARMDGMVVFEDPNGNGGREHVLRGTADSTVSGVIYTPHTPFSMLGATRGETRCLSIAAFTVQIGGSANLSNLCPAGRSSEIQVSTGGGVAIRLVA